MAKKPKKKVTAKAVAEDVQVLGLDIAEAQREIEALRTDLNDSNEAIDDLEEAICPRVAARLTALEKNAEGSSIGYRARFERLESVANNFLADEQMKLKALNAITGLGAKLGSLAARIASLEERADERLKDVPTQPEADISGFSTPQPTLRGPDPYIVAQKLYERDCITARRNGETVSFADTWINLPSEVRIEIAKAAEELIAIVQSS
jgi:hypothetical protein